MSEYIHVLPADIEAESFNIIGQILKEKNIVLPKDQELITKRVIHTTADFSYVDTLSYANDAINIAHQLIKKKACFVTDTNMAFAGINKGRLAKFGCQIRCFMADEDVAAEAKERGVTRATVSMERAAHIEGPVIYVVGNAPTALIEIYDNLSKNIEKEFLVIGVPVGFVNVEYAKDLYKGSKIPYIINFGRKGGSNVAAAIVNALLITCEGK